MSKVRGKNVLVLFYDPIDTTWKPYACAMSCTLNINTDIVETSEVGAGSWGTHRAIKNSFDGSITGLVNLNRSDTLSLADLRQKQINFQKMQIKFQRTDESGNTYITTGYFLIAKSTDDGPDGSISNFSIELKGTGELVSSLTIAIVRGVEIITENSELITDETGNVLITD